jgi:hypothetical protein
MDRIGQPIPGRHETQSFSLTPQEREKINTIHYALLRLNAEDLRGQLQRSIVSMWPNPDVVNKLYDALCAVGIVQSHMIAGANDVTRRHCVRCHKGYKEKENSPTSCIFKRPILWENADGSTEKKHLDQYVSRHTTRVESVNYDNAHFFSCEAVGCAGRDIPSRTPSPSSSDPGRDTDLED